MSAVIVTIAELGFFFIVFCRDQPCDVEMKFFCSFQKLIIDSGVLKEKNSDKSRFSTSSLERVRNQNCIPLLGGGVRVNLPNKSSPDHRWKNAKFPDGFFLVNLCKWSTGSL